MKKQPEQMPEDQRFHDTYLLLKKYRDVVYLHYYEDYTAPEIGAILGRNVNTVYTLLTRSKELLRKRLGGDGDE